MSSFKKGVKANLIKIDELLTKSLTGISSSTQGNIEGGLGIKFPLIANTYKEKIELIKAGFMDLSIQEISTIWGSMFEEKNIVYLRATSLISPNIWENPFMIKYDLQQRENVEFINALSEKERLEFETKVEQAFAERGIQMLENTNFERTFVITNYHLSDPEQLVDLVDTICHQSEYFNLKICYEENLVAQERLDFGIAVTRDGEIWFYELNTFRNSLYGGRISFNQERIKQAAQTYKTIQAFSEPIPSNVDFESVAQIVNRLINYKVDVDLLRELRHQKEIKAAHKCLKCFLESENTIKKDGWKDLEDSKQLWYEMLIAENEAVLNYVRKEKPQRIIEVGCGPGRFIGLLHNLGLENFQEIIGVECDAQMYDRAYKRFKGYMPTIKLLKMEVKEFLPYEDDYFDLCINAMNIVGWQENARDWLKEMLRCSKSVFFTVYKDGNDDIRIQMYKDRGHDTSDRAVHKNLDGQIVLGDCAVIPSIKSRAYTENDIGALCDSISTVYDCEFTIDRKANRLLYLCFLKKNSY